jgi:asparagine synthase (glutamine-hydrolysing)
MCGITGVISSVPVAASGVGAAIDSLKHRGPEGRGQWEDGNVVLGHTRLCIIDLSKEAAQPLHYADRYVIIHNGELYNYLEIKKELQQKGHSFSTASDTEVIAAAYHAYGPSCLQRFEGMFAFAIWDRRERTLFIARDRMGEKPLFFYYDGELLAFASEIKALWALGIVKEVNMSLLYNYLTTGYTSNPADPQETFYHNIQNLPPASFLLYRPNVQELKTEKYWQLEPEENYSIFQDEAVHRLQALLNDSIKKRLRSDVAIGTSLSGGLDSSTLVALCSSMASEQYTHKCFTAVFEGFEKNEAKHAIAVVKKFNLRHYPVTITASEVPALMDEVMRHQEIPVSSASALAQFRVYQAAKENGVTVLLDGQGADETFGGYHRYYRWYWQQLYREKKLGSSGELEAARKLGVKESFAMKTKLAAMFPDFAASLLQTVKSRQAFRQNGLNRDFAFSNKRNLYYSTPAHFTLNGILYFNTFVYGLEELLRLADRNSMAHATEVRLPYLHHPLVEFLFTLPAHLKIRNGWTKWLLRKTAEPLLPSEIVWRKDKVGFEPPQKLWMQDKQVEESIRHSKQLLVSQGILDASAAQAKIRPHDAHAADTREWRYWSAGYLFKP